MAPLKRLWRNRNSPVDVVKEAFLQNPASRAHGHSFTR